MLIQVILVAIGVLTVVWFLRSGRTSAISAGKKAGLILLGLVMIVSILNPSLTTWVAQRIGVGRGADLLLYILAMAFLAYALTQYANRQKDREIVHMLARRVALLEARETYGPRPAPPAFGGPQRQPELGRDEESAQ